MNPFEQFTIIIGLLAVLFEGAGYVRAYFQKILH